ncbi:hypothetical protein C8A05DRAFT_35851 [Staphylotrichum tortipilum]|uniref:Uncharacterized protein n=1 Tax=Staphylotrichum tortipilum TaxID=2831512 RepID=A0AAN6MGY5_9PEZI|nr:hypothetical protein C8A05DRAFT_35851 [Staphylotrichum longicolle]
MVQAQFIFAGVGTLKNHSERNITQSLHAKEVVFWSKNKTRVKIAAFFSRLKPSSENRYGHAHGCHALFNGGRKVGNLEGCRFEPVPCSELSDAGKGNYAVVFYLEDAPPVGQRSDSAALGRPGKRNTTPPGRNTMAYAGGVDVGTPLKHGDYWHLEGQDDSKMTQEELLRHCANGGLRKSTWNWKDPRVADDKAAWVYERLKP